MFHITDAQAQAIFAALAVIYAIYVLERIRAELQAISYNTGRASENIANMLNVLYDINSRRAGSI